MTAENNEELTTMDNHTPAPPANAGVPKPLDNHTPVAPAKGKSTATTQDNHTPAPPAP
ncbi:MULTISPECIES: sigma-like protein [unclassified Streptomyces]|uniref:sigma-like protein n=1 Tax=unclassified Streptomyces TaxID=2593676 RepID=UPI000A92EFD5|nr:sigma-like protein [Streptomyces sp. NBC_00370]